MSNSAQTRIADQSPRVASVFAALGDPTRLALVAKLCDGSSPSIARLSADEPLARQAISKHLRVLEDASIVHSRRAGRESLYALDPEPIREIQDYMALVSSQWGDALSRLKSLVER